MPVQVRSTKDCLALLQRGDQNRIFASTEMNAHSSRSHAIVIVTVIKRRKRAMTRNENGEQVTGQCVSGTISHGGCIAPTSLLCWAPVPLECFLYT